MKVLLLGATGLIGHHCLEGLLAAPGVAGIIAPTRRSLSIENAKLQNPPVDFDHLDQHPELFDVSAILCCLGTTMKQAGSKDSFRKVDYQYCIDAARLGRARGVKAFLVVSAIGASTSSSFFYSRVKGELERDLKALQYPHLSIYHPSMLLGEREEFRLGERLINLSVPLFNPLLRGPLQAYHAIPGQTVARAMVNEALALGDATAASPEVHVHAYRDIVRLAKHRNT